MARPLRLPGAGRTYHVMARGNNRMAIFRDDLDCARFLGLIRAVIDRYAVDCLVYCVMPNHYHLVIRTRLANISEAVRQVNGRYAQWWNRRHGHIGHVFQARFKAQVVESGVYLVRLCRYVLRNPTRAGLCSVPDDWRWSSLADLHGGGTSLANVGLLCDLVGAGDSSSVRAALIAHVQSEDRDMASFVRSNRRVIGGTAFAAQLGTRMRGLSAEVPRAERRVGTPTVPTIVAEALQAGEGLGVGVRRAFAASYSCVEIAASTGLARRSVARILRADAGICQTQT